MQSFIRTKAFVLSTAIIGVLMASFGCQPPATSTNANTVGNSSLNASVGNANAPVAGNVNSVSSTNGNSANAATVSIDTREPEVYQAAVTLKLTTMGAQPANLPPVTAQVARNGADRRMEFTLPNKEKVIYLDAAGKHYLISPDRKQFAELNQESLGFEVRNLMTPAQIVQQVKNLKGVERVGEETVDGRTAIKYRLNTTTDTKSQAGNMQTESVILVDKETGLPLRSETNSQSENGGQVKGVSGLRLVTEMSNISTAVTPDLFAPPKDYKQVAPEEVRGQVTALFNVAAALLGNVMKNAQTNPSPVISPAVSPTP